MVKERLLACIILVVIDCTASGDSEKGVLVPAEIDPSITVAPNAPYTLQIPIGHAQLVQFSCWGGPADAVLSLRTYTEHSDPLIFLSFGDNRPDLSHHDLSSFDQWLEDSHGEHYLVLKAVGPEGGVLGVLNTQHFAAEEFRGILSIRCSFIMAFDAFFWDHLQSSSVCPIGKAPVVTALQRDELPVVVCSGHGRCGKHSNCECAAGWTGPACASEIYDLVASSCHHYELEVSHGHYKYFRVRVTPSFRGGFLEVNVSASAPLIVLVSGSEKGLPTKRSFDLSNFDDWMQRRTTSRLQFRVHSPMSDEYFSDSSNRHLAESLYANADIPGEIPLHMPAVACPSISPGWQDPSCHTQQFARCETNCATCISCNKTAREDDMCGTACKICLTSRCIEAFSTCAASVGCMGGDAHECESKCSNCMACLDSNDPACRHCRCCTACLPLAAKCGLLSSTADDVNYLHIAVFNHHRFDPERSVINGVVDLGLREEPHFVEPTREFNWIGALYDRFQDIQDLEFTQRTRYPDGEQFLYDINFNRSDTIEQEVRLFSQRLTLLHLLNAGSAENVELSFTAGPDITHVLTASSAAPKTLFDFDQVQALHPHTGKIHVDMLGKSTIWCALFAGDEDASVIITARSFGHHEDASPMVFTFLSIFTVLCCLIVCGAVYNGLAKSAERNPGRREPQSSISERLASLVRTTPSNRTPGTSERSQGRSLQGYMSAASDFMDPSVEEQYLFRGGIGDDGM